MKNENILYEYTEKANKVLSTVMIIGVIVMMIHVLKGDLKILSPISMFVGAIVGFILI